MILQELLTILDECNVRTISIANSFAPLMGFLDYPKDPSEAEDGILYFATDNDLKKFKPIDGILSILYFGEKSYTEVLDLTNVNFLQIPSVKDRHKASLLINKKLVMDMRSHEVMRELTNALFENRGLQHILDKASQILSNPMMAFGRSYNYILQTYSSSNLEPDAPIKKIIDEFSEAASGSLAVDQMIDTYILDKEIVRRLRSSNHYIRHFNPALGCEQLSMLIKVKGIEVGKLVLIEACRPISEFDEMIFERLGLLLSQELQKRALYTKNRNEVKAQFVNYLLNSQEISPDRVYRFTSIDKVINLHERFYVVVVQKSNLGSEVDPAVFDLITEQIKPILRESLYLVKDTELVILFNLKKSANLQELIQEPLQDLIRGNNLTAGVSNPFDNLIETKKYYAQAKKAAELGAEYQQWPINYFSIIAPIEMFHLISRYDDLKAYCFPTVFDLLEYDKKNNSSLVTTLYVYLDNFGNTAKSAEMLYIHKNTLLYRMQKIKDILHCQLENGEEVYRIMMSLRIIRVLGLYVYPDEYLLS